MSIVILSPDCLCMRRFCKKNQKGAEKEPKTVQKEPKRSRKEAGNIRAFEEKSYNDTNAAYAGIDINKKTDPNGYEGATGRRCACQRRF